MILLSSCIIALILLIWFRTEAWLEYCRLFHLDIASGYKDFDNKQKQDVSLTYILYLRKYKNCFGIRLVTCPICFAIWLGICCGIVTSWTLIPVYVIGGLLLFTIIDKLLG